MPQLLYYWLLVSRTDLNAEREQTATLSPLKTQLVDSHQSECSFVSSTVFEQLPCHCTHILNFYAGDKTNPEELSNSLTQAEVHVYTRRVSKPPSVSTPASVPSGKLEESYSLFCTH